MKIIAFYLPQFHSIPENDKWWGEGFTEWTNLKKAKPLFQDHYQPRIPLQNNYYNLLEDDVMEWQVNLAKKHGLFGFCFYHYWFDGHLLLEKPLQNYLNNKNIDFPFCMSWANVEWTQAWVSKEDNVIMKQNYGDEANWKKHFDYLLPFFKDSRYIKIDEKPMFIIYKPDEIKDCKKMMLYWNELAKNSGLSGITFVFQHYSSLINPEFDPKDFDYGIEYEPFYTLYNYDSKLKKIVVKTKHSIEWVARKVMKKNIISIRNVLRKEDYNSVWEKIINRGSRYSEDLKLFPGAFVDLDNTPRRENKGIVTVGANPKDFQKHLSNHIKNAKSKYKQDYMFMFAWNEWAEGGYLEPDSKYGYEYLEAIEKALNDNGEIPNA